MKKRFVILMTMLFLSLSSAFGQIIYTDEDAGFNPRQTTQTNELGVMVPMQNSDMDQWKFVPVGSGLALLTGMGGLYLLAKRRKE